MLTRRLRGWQTYALIVALTSAEGTLTILVAPYLETQGYDFATIGILVAILGIMALVSRLPAGMLYQPQRGPALMLGSLLALGLTSVLYPLVPGPWLFGLVRGLNGLALGIATTTNLAMYMDAIPAGRDKAQAMGVYAGSLATGYMIGNFVGGMAGDRFGFTPAFGLSGLFAAIAAVLLLVEPRPSPPPPRPRAATPLSHSLSDRLSTSLRPMKAFSEPRVVALSMVAYSLNFLHQIGGTFFPLYGISIGLSLTELGLIRSTHAMVNAIARPLAGPPISRFGYRRVSFLGIGLLAALFMLLPTLRSFTGLLILFILIGLLRAVVLVANTVGIADIDERRMSRGLASGLYNASKDLGNLASPVICGAVASALTLTGMFVLVPPLAMLFFAGTIATFGSERKARATAPPEPS